MIKLAIVIINCIITIAIVLNVFENAKCYYGQINNIPLWLYIDRFQVLINFRQDNVICVSHIRRLVVRVDPTANY